MNKITKKNIAAFCLASFFNDWCHEMGTAILPMFIAQLVGGAQAPMILGIVQGVSDGASTIMKLMSGFLADKVSFYKPFLIFGYGLTGIFIGLLGTAQTVWMILVYKSFAWMSRGLREPIRDTWLSKIVSPTIYGRIFGLQRMCDSFGALLGPLSAFILIKMHFPLSFIFFCAAIPGIISALPIILLTQEQKEVGKRKTFHGYIEQLKQLPSQFTHFLYSMFIFGIGNFNQMLIIYRIQELLSFGSNRLSLFATLSGVLLYVFFNLIRSMSEFGMGALSDYVDKRILLAIAGFGLFGITSILCMFNTTSLLFWLFVIMCTGISVGTVKVLEKVYASILLPEHVRGTGFGLLQTIDGIGDLISSLIVGTLWTVYSPIIALLYAAVLSFAAMIIFLIKKI